MLAPYTDRIYANFAGHLHVNVDEPDLERDMICTSPMRCGMIQLRLDSWMCIKMTKGYTLNKS